MKFRKFNIKGLLEIIPEVYRDERGYFFESFNAAILEREGLYYPFVQDNQSYSIAGIIRGIHFQRKPFEQAKLVRVIQGKVLDIAVDLRPDSETFGKYQKIVLDSEINNIIFIPAGFGHGFYAIENSIFFYKCTNFYSREHETGIIWNDPDLAIDWETDNPVLSKKDRSLPTFKSFIQSIN